MHLELNKLMVQFDSQTLPFPMVRILFVCDGPSFTASKHGTHLTETGHTHMEEISICLGPPVKPKLSWNKKHIIVCQLYMENKSKI